MPEISLNDYFAKLNSLLSSGAADEVIQNSRHILQHYPKNVAATRYLGRALVINGAWPEGRETLRRVLSVIPDDYAAHLGLSEANERLNRADEAIWHLERAFEQRPNDKDLIDALRGLYRRHRKIDNLKIQLTSATVARQYLRSGAFTQAIDALRGALARMNDRLDLKLLLAQTLWQQGAEEESAEIALEVLKVLPDCLEANKIMAQLWLGENRPSDAQRYVNHLESVDPYLAVELVQGEPPDDDVFRVEELDYARTSQSQMTSARPDWLREISSVPSSADDAEQPASELSDWASAMLGPQKPPPAQSSRPPASAPNSASARFAAMSKGDDAAAPSNMTDIFGPPDESSAGELSALFDAPPSADDPMAWLRDTGVQIVDDEEPSYKNLFDDNESALPEDEHPLAWLKDANSDLLVDDDQPPADDAFAWVNAEARPTSAPQDAGDGEDSLSWLQGDALLDEALDLDDMADGTAPDLATQRMKIPGAPASKPEQGADDPPDVTVPGPKRGLTAMLQESNFDWAKKPEENVVSDDEMDDWLNQFGPSEPRKSINESPEWLDDLEQPEMSSLESDEWFKPEDAAPTPEITLPPALVLMGSEEDEEEDSDWLAEFAPQDEPSVEAASAGLDEAALEWQSPAAVEETPELADASEDIASWLSSLETEDDEEAEDEPAEEQPVTEDTGEDEFAWMTEEPLTDAESASDEEIDWLTALAPPELEPDSASPEAIPEAEMETPASADTGLAWTRDEAEANEELLSENMPDWLTDLQSTASAVADDKGALEDAASWTTDTPAEPEAVSSKMPGWLADIQAEAIQAEPESAASDTDFSWMTDEKTTSEPAAAVSASEFAWMTEVEAPAQDEPKSEADAEASGTPDWLSQFTPSPETGEAAAVSASEFAWMTEDEATAQDEPESEADAEAELVETPDWLAAIAPPELETTAETGEAAAVSASEFAWMTEDEAPAEVDLEDELEDEAEAEPAEAPDWLAAIAPPEADVSEAAAVSASEFAWMTEDEAPGEDEVEPADAEPAEVPDWLAAVAPPDAEPAEAPDWLAAVAPPESAQAAAVSASEFAWMTEDEAPANDDFEDELEDEAEAEPAEAPDWLAAVAPQASKPAAQPVVDAKFDWMTTDTSDEQEAEPEAADEVSEPDWLGELNLPEQAEEAEPELAGANITWTSDELQPPAAESRAEAVAEIDWLTELAPPELAPETEADEQEFTADEIEAADEFSWLDEEEAPAETEAQPVMGVLVGEDEPQEIAASLEADELAEGEDEILEPAPAHNAPDWLNAMVPGLDVDYEAGGEPAVEEEAAEPAVASAKREFDWLVEMVEEETAATENARFVFSRPPMWLERTNGASHGNVVDDDLPDWPSDDADADVPEWLR